MLGANTLQDMLNYVLICQPLGRGERLLQTQIVIGQEVQLPSSDWTRATELYLLSSQSMSL